MSERKIDDKALNNKCMNYMINKRNFKSKVKNVSDYKVNSIVYMPYFFYSNCV